jgi:hypothetical protein
VIVNTRDSTRASLWRRTPLPKGGNGTTGTAYGVLYIGYCVLAIVCGVLYIAYALPSLQRPLRRRCTQEIGPHTSARHRTPR